MLGARHLSAGQLPRLLQDSAKSAQARALVADFLHAAIDQKAPADSLLRFSTDSFRKMLIEQGQDTLWKISPKSLAIGSVSMVREIDSVLMVTAVTVNDSVPRFGPLEVDWVFFLQPDEHGKMLIGSLRRMNGIDRNVEELRFLDTTSTYPSSLKPAIFYEETALLLSNRQLREYFLANKPGFMKLLGEFSRHDSLTMLGRVDHNVTQLNRFGIEWGLASHNIPKEALDEFFRTATPEEQQAMRVQLRQAENVRRSGLDTLARLARNAKLSVAHIDSVIELMRQLRISFVNRKLPWTDAVQFTVDGRFGNAMGFLYSPHGEVPLIDPQEYYYLEQIGDGWWIFRTT